MSTLTQIEQESITAFLKRYEQGKSAGMLNDTYTPPENIIEAEYYARGFIEGYKTHRDLLKAGIIKPNFIGEHQVKEQNGEFYIPVPADFDMPSKNRVG